MKQKNWNQCPTFENVAPVVDAASFSTYLTCICRLWWIDIMRALWEQQNLFLKHEAGKNTGEKCVPSGYLMNQGKEICKNGDLFTSSRCFRNVREGGNGQLIPHVVRGRIAVVLEERPSTVEYMENHHKLMNCFLNITHSLCSLDIHLPCDSSVALQHSDKDSKICQLPWSYILGLFINKTCPLVP